MVVASFSLIFFVLATFEATSSLPQDGYFVHPNARHDPIDPRIIGGEQASPHEFPFQVGLYCNTASRTFFCGGSLVSNNYIITAAHCVESAISVDIILGAHTITKNETSQVKLTSSEFVIHKGWNKTLLINDIAFIKLPAKVEENDYIKIVPLASGRETYAGKLGTITGWGRTADNQDSVTPDLRYVVSSILSNEDCKSLEEYASVIKPTHLCISGVAKDVNVGTCNGDSGGPLTIDGLQIGLVSFGYKECAAGKPSVFTRLTEFSDWIGQHSDVAF